MLPHADVTTPAERWATIARFPGYEFSDFGRVRSYWKNRRDENDQPIGEPRFLRPHKARGGYPAVMLLHPDGAKRVRLVHRLVLEAFVGPCPDGREGCHKDGNPENPHIDNLYWGTRSQNNFDRVRHERHPNAKMTCEQVEEALRLHGEGWSFVALGEKYGVRHTSVRSRLMNQGVGKSFSHIGPDELRRLQLLDALGFQRKSIAKMAGRSVDALHRVLGDAPGWERKTTAQKGKRGLRRKYSQEAPAP